MHIAHLPSVEGVAVGGVVVDVDVGVVGGVIIGGVGPG